MVRPDIEIKTKDDLRKVLRAGGVNDETFDRDNVKTLEELFEETKEGVRVRVARDKDGKLFVARCALTVAVQVRVPSQFVHYVETERWIRKTGELIPKRRDFTISGTRRKGVELMDDAVREIDEELKIKVKTSEVKLPPILFESQRHPKPYKSSAYPVLMTCATIQLVRWEPAELPWSEPIRVIQDGWKDCVIHRQPYELAQPNFADFLEFPLGPF